MKSWNSFDITFEAKETNIHSLKLLICKDFKLFLSFFFFYHAGFGLSLACTCVVAPVHQMPSVFSTVCWTGLSNRSQRCSMSSPLCLHLRAFGTFSYTDTDRYLFSGGNSFNYSSIHDKKKKFRILHLQLLCAILEKLYHYEIINKSLHECVVKINHMFLDVLIIQVSICSVFLLVALLCYSFNTWPALARLGLTISSFPPMHFVTSLV